MLKSISSCAFLVTLLPGAQCFVSPRVLPSLRYIPGRFGPNIVSETRTPLLTSAIPFSNSTVQDRFQRTAKCDTASTSECVIEIDGIRYNMTAWAKAHPGGQKILHKFHEKDASTAFHSAGHSPKAYAMLRKFAINENQRSDRNSTALVSSPTHNNAASRRPRWMQKLFTKEDPIGIHKYLGIFCLLHFAFRYRQMYFGDIGGGFGSRMGRGPSIKPALCLVPHLMLSLSSLIFRTVPRERVVGKPMIWQEFRAHNIIFGVRSVVCTFLAWLSLYHSHKDPWRRVAVVGSCMTALCANLLADEATKRLRSDTSESTTATMPYWDGCSVETQKRFKTFYAYCQFMATLACIAVCSPVWGLAVLLAIQFASLAMTLVRKGLLSPKGYHIAYTITLIMPFAVGFRSHSVLGPWAFPVMMIGGGILFQVRRVGLNKFSLWLPVYASRIVFGDRFIPYDVW